MNGNYLGLDQCSMSTSNTVNNCWNVLQNCF